MKYRLDKEIQQLQLELAALSELRGTIQTKGWKYIVEIFQAELSRLVQTIYDLAKEPEKHAMELRCRHMVVEALGGILSSIDNRVAKEDYLKKQFEEKNAVLAQMQARHIEPL